MRQVLMEAEDIRSKAGVKGGCEPSSVGSGNQSLKEQELETDEPTLQSLSPGF